jgi:hypothetical protein
MLDWEFTRKTYVNWLSNSALRKQISDEIKYDDLSIWWISKLMAKDNINEQIWFKNLNFKLHSKKTIKENKLNYLILSSKLIINILFKLISILTIKLFFFRKGSYKTLKHRDCYYTLMSNYKYHKGNYIDRQYGLINILKNNNKINIIELPENLDLIKNFFSIRKKIKSIEGDFIILNSRINLIEIIKIYINFLFLLFKTLKILRKKNYFFIKKKNCRDILEKKLISSFFGYLQNQIIKGVALKKTINFIKPKNFITCFDFYPEARIHYHYARKGNAKNIININHAIYSENDIFFNINKSDFTTKPDSSFSPKPDIFFCKGEKYYKRLKKIFVNERVYKIGSLKIELNSLKFNRLKQKKDNDQKILAILCGINDYKPFIKILNQCDLGDTKIYVFSHPVNVKETLKYFKTNLNFVFFEGNNLNREKILRNSDHIIFGDTMLGFELALKKFNVFRLYDKEFIPTFDITNDIPTACDTNSFKKLIKKNNSFRKTKKLEKDFFYRYDMKASKRFLKILKNVK